MIKQNDMKEYMDGVIDEIQDIAVEDGSNKQAFKTMIKMTSRLRYTKVHLLGDMSHQPENYNLLLESIKNDEHLINLYRGVLGLDPLDF